MFFFNLAISAGLISFCAWLAQKRPELAGFIISLPISTLLVLALTQIQSGDNGRAALLAKSIFVGVPATLVFFIPFLLTGRFRLPFWAAYGSGIALLTVAFFVHRWIFGYLAR